ncbi:MAG: hypothetical protein GY792_27810 [Gammaproteobacteria bacterium]|nr:hypothetical protein [Gammaproteobacteria bacterium]
MSYQKWLLLGLLSVFLTTVTTEMRIAAAMERLGIVDMPSFSEEDPPSICPSGYLVKGVRCSGHYCDNKSLRCQRNESVLNVNESHWSQWFSEERSRRRPEKVKSNEHFVAGLACSGSYCDNLRVFFMKGRKMAQNCSWTKAFSEEQGYRECPSGKFVSGLKCSGSYCDNIRLYCCRP